jgi:hypothetical protein
MWIVGQDCAVIGHKGLDSINSQRHVGDHMWDGHHIKGNAVCGSRWGQDGRMFRRCVAVWSPSTQKGGGRAA